MLCRAAPGYCCRGRGGGRIGRSRIGRLLGWRRGRRPLGCSPFGLVGAVCIALHMRADLGREGFGRR